MPTLYLFALTTNQFTGLSLEVEDLSQANALAAPHGFTTVPPPELAEGQVAVWDINFWRVETPVVDLRPVLVIDTVELIPAGEPGEPGEFATWDSLAQEVTVTVGGTVKAVGRTLHPISGEVLTEVTDTFRMPVIHEDGKKTLTIATITNGVIHASFRAEEAGEWYIREEVMNIKIPVGKRLRLGNGDITVLAVQRIPPPVV